jgi:hypothetical protein
MGSFCGLRRLRHFADLAFSSSFTALFALNPMYPSECGVSVAGAADVSVPAPRHYVEAQEVGQYPWPLACPTRQCWVWHSYAWDPEYNNEIGHFRGVPLPPPPPPADEWAGFLAPSEVFWWI